jgi:hypothetical protein
MGAVIEDPEGTTWDADEVEPKKVPVGLTMFGPAWKDWRNEFDDEARMGMAVTHPRGVWAPVNFNSENGHLLNNNNKITFPLSYINMSAD